MEIIHDTEFAVQQARYLKRTTRGPVVIESGGEAVAVVLSPGRYERLQDLEDMIYAGFDAQATD